MNDECGNRQHPASLEEILLGEVAFALLVQGCVAGEIQGPRRCRKRLRQIPESMRDATSGA